MSDELIAEAVLGRDAEDFLNTDIGRYLIGCADQEIEDSVELLKRVSPENHMLIREYQARIWRAESFKSWMGEIITRGRHAIRTIDQATED